MNNSIISGIKLRKYRNSCRQFAIEELGQSPDPWQLELYDVFSSPDPDKKRIAMKACKGVGKTTGLATCILNFLLCYGDTHDHPKGAGTSITEDNIDDNLWPEIAKWQSRSEILKHAFKWTKSRIHSVDHPETWFFSKRTWPKSADPSQQANTLAGLHSKYLLFVADESGDIPDAVLAAADAGLTGTEEGRFQKILQAGNPTKRSGPLFRATNLEKFLWYVITITGDPENPNRSTRQSKEWALDQIKRYGIDSPWVQVNVFGEYPEHSINALLSDVDVNKAFDRNLHYDGYKMSQKRIGCDVARQGEDMTVLFPRQGLRAFQWVEMSGARTYEIADRLIMSKEKWHSEREFIDGTGGFGGGVVDSMTQRGYDPIEVHFASKATDPRYFNKRAEMYFRMRDWIKRGGQIPRDDKILKELCATTYTNKSGKIILSPKDIIKADLGFSPDRMDALALTFADPEAVGRLTLEGQVIQAKSNHCKTEWNPYDDNSLES